MPTRPKKPTTSMLSKIFPIRRRRASRRFQETRRQVCASQSPLATGAAVFGWVMPGVISASSLLRRDVWHSPGWSARRGLWLPGGQRQEELLQAGLAPSNLGGINALRAQQRVDRSEEHT